MKLDLFIELSFFPTGNHKWKIPAQNGPIYGKQVSTVVLPYLGQDDHKLKIPPPDLVTREEAFGYPTDFSAMTPEWIDRLSLRGEQLTKALIAEHAPDLAEISG